MPHTRSVRGFARSSIRSSPSAASTEGPTSTLSAARPLPLDQLLPRKLHVAPRSTTFRPRAGSTSTSSRQHVWGSPAPDRPQRRAYDERQPPARSIAPTRTCPRQCYAAASAGVPASDGWDGVRRSTTPCREVLTRRAGALSGGIRMSASRACRRPASLPESARTSARPSAGHSAALREIAALRRARMGSSPWSRPPRTIAFGRRGTRMRW